MLVPIVLSIVILISGVIRFLQMKSNYEANQIKLEACIDIGGTVVIEQKHVLALSSATCEES
ncbi:hypothetical protein [Neobacillus sp. 19]|uniref:hypothetical protein n=1 Tax=Neobacillus sp. 19 TaxID=3394458 RepID=UPI003C2C5B7B